MNTSVKVAAKVRPSEAGGPPSTVSVVIPCYNYARFLPQAVTSALSQSSADVSVIVVDDRSTDASLEVARSLAAKDPRVTVIANERNCGMVETFNRGLREATGDFLVRLDADDLLTPGALERALPVFHAYPSVGLVYGHPLHFESEIPPTPRTRARAWTVWPGRQWLADRCADGYNVITSPEVVMRMSVVNEAGPQQPLRHTPDMEMWLRLAAFGDVAYIHGVDQAWHREHAASMSATEVDDVIDLIERREAFDVLFSGPVGKLAGAQSWRESATAALARESVERARREFDRGRGDSEASRTFVRLAHELAVDPTRVPGWRALERRVAWGAKVSSAPWLSVLPRIGRRLRTSVRYSRWERSGVFGSGTGSVNEA